MTDNYNDMCHTCAKRFLESNFNQAVINLISNFHKILPFPNTSAPARLRLPVPHVSTKSLKSSLSLHAKILFYIWNSELSVAKGIIMK